MAKKQKMQKIAKREIAFDFVSVEENLAAGLKTKTIFLFQFVFVSFQH
jgi:ABC-type Fe2+-enterobactin transport system substrate-binding protein